MVLPCSSVINISRILLRKELCFYFAAAVRTGCQNIAEIALDEGYNVIKVQSYRDAGINYVIYNNFDEILQPQMVTPIGD